MEDNEIPAAGEMLKTALDQTNLDHIDELKFVLNEIYAAALKGKTSADLQFQLRSSVKAVLRGKNYFILEAEGRGGKFTSIDFKSELDRIIRAYQESNKDA